MKRPIEDRMSVAVSEAEISTGFYRRSFRAEVVKQIRLVQGMWVMNDLAIANRPGLMIEMIRRKRINGCNLAYVVADVAAACKELETSGARVCTRTRNGEMACVSSPDGVCAELIPLSEGRVGTAETGRAASR
ncbi:hypothetical protein Herbaro_02875 [Herbaspirillum sp. WKF16]|jgi:hypothetical protein|uniref:hypothetical protein n=1 Tax=Herbaspirillum sp. WKF16 TaxID=3028312 RepID=UPI0023A91C08|nr:hypothetical protein [Herbaspirillum sp. WKF16]WDZ96747.1 hypothetical protein Herbaro_02875 [Herbaspirillum sp. WKF16]